MRYILNNFFDGHKQDALDLLSGTYTIKKGVLLPKALLCSCWGGLQGPLYACLPILWAHGQGGQVLQCRLLSTDSPESTMLCTSLGVSTEIVRACRRILALQAIRKWTHPHRCGAPPVPEGHGLAVPDHSLGTIPHSASVCSSHRASRHVCLGKTRAMIDNPDLQWCTQLLM